MHTTHITLSDPSEPSIFDQCEIDLYHALRDARRADSYLPLTVISEMLCECLEAGEHELLANLLMDYETRRLTAEVCSF